MNRRDDELTELLNMFTLCKEFHQLPFPGGMLDQPWKLYLVFEMMQTATFEREAKDQKEAERKNARKRP